MEDNKNIKTQESEVKEETKVYSAEEVQKMIEEGRKQALEEANKKADERFQYKLKESEKLAKMNENEKLIYELEKREKAIEAKEKELTLAQNRNEAGKILADKGLSLSLVDFVVAEDAETMNERIKVLEKAFKDSVKKEIEKRLGSSAPKRTQPTEETITKEQAKKMTIRERQHLLDTNPTLFNELFK